MKYAYELDPDLKATQKNGQNAMHLAVLTALRVETLAQTAESFKEAAAVVQFLGDHGADLNAVDANGKTALDLTLDYHGPTEVLLTHHTRDLLIQLMRAADKAAKR